MDRSLVTQAIDANLFRELQHYSRVTIHVVSHATARFWGSWGRKVALIADWGQKEKGVCELPAEKRAKLMPEVFLRRNVQ